MSNTQTPKYIRLDNTCNALHLHYPSDNEGVDKYSLSAEYLRVHSPSAEVNGHGSQSAAPQSGKQCVVLKSLCTVGNYALKLMFDDGHDSGLYTWEYLHELCVNQDHYWHTYEKRLHHAGLHRHPHESSIKLMK